MAEKIRKEREPFGIAAAYYIVKGEKAMEDPDQSFEQVFERNVRSVYRACYLRLRHKQDAEDAAQAVFLSYLDRSGRLKMSAMSAHGF